MATKKQKRAAGIAKREAFEKSVKDSGLAALRGDQARREEQNASVQSLEEKITKKAAHLGEKVRIHLAPGVLDQFAAKAMKDWADFIRGLEGSPHSEAAQKAFLNARTQGLPVFEEIELEAESYAVQVRLAEDANDLPARAVARRGWFLFVDSLMVSPHRKVAKDAYWKAYTTFTQDDPGAVETLLDRKKRIELTAFNHGVAVYKAEREEGVLGYQQARAQWFGFVKTLGNGPMVAFATAAYEEGYDDGSRRNVGG